MVVDGTACVRLDVVMVTVAVAGTVRVAVAILATVVTDVLVTSAVVGASVMVAVCGDAVTVLVKTVTAGTA